MRCCDKHDELEGKNSLLRYRTCTKQNTCTQENCITVAREKCKDSQNSQIEAPPPASIIFVTNEGVLRLSVVCVNCIRVRSRRWNTIQPNLFVNSTKYCEKLKEGWMNGGLPVLPCVTSRSIAEKEQKISQLIILVSAWVHGQQYASQLHTCIVLEEITI